MAVPRPDNLAKVPPLFAMLHEFGNAAPGVGLRPGRVPCPRANNLAKVPSPAANLYLLAHSKMVTRPAFLSSFWTSLMVITSSSSFPFSSGVTLSSVRSMQTRSLCCAALALQFRSWKQVFGWLGGLWPNGMALPRPDDLAKVFTMLHEFGNAAPWGTSAR